MKIVILDDSPIGLIINSYILEEAYPRDSIQSFEEVSDMIEYLESTEERMIVLLDYYLPETTGISVYKSLTKKAKANKAFALFSIGIPTQLSEECKAIGILDCIDKSLHKSEIIKRVAALKDAPSIF
jgi:response regulator RpfG family c-di-GMP phosphodiesterase